MKALQHVQQWVTSRLEERKVKLYAEGFQRYVHNTWREKKGTDLASQGHNDNYDWMKLDGILSGNQLGGPPEVADLIVAFDLFMDSDKSDLPNPIRQFFRHHRRCQRHNGLHFRL